MSNPLIQRDENGKIIIEENPDLDKYLDDAVRKTLTKRFGESAATERIIDDFKSILKDIMINLNDFYKAVYDEKYDKN